MHLSFLLAAIAVLISQVLVADARTPFDTTTPFSSTFQQPPPPLIKAAFKANWNQHKWNANLSNIASGFVYTSPASKKVRVDEAFDSTLGSSLFDYNNVTAKGVYNVVWTLTPSLTSTPSFFTGYVAEPAFPLLTADVLIKGNAVYAGTATNQDDGDLTKWNFLFNDIVPTTVLVDEDNVIHGYDIWSPVLRTYVITRLFNIVVGEFSSEVFNFPQPGGQ